MKNFFFSKINLFGEYGVLLGARGLIVPYRNYYGYLTTSNLKFNQSSIKSIELFINFLKKDKRLMMEFDWDKINSDVEKNLYFESNIPQGYGIGSSGALVAAFYKKYFIKNSFFGKDINKLKKIFIQMESYFHGNSSGYDPLTSYLNHPIIINRNNTIERVSLPILKSKKSFSIFILDSGIQKDTQFMVNLFLDRINNNSFKQIIKKEFINNSEKCIDFFLSGNFSSFILNVKKLSYSVVENFIPMIPKNLLSDWKYGIENDLFFLKLCGSGGGGFFLGFTENINQTKKYFKNHQIQIIYNF